MPQDTVRDATYQPEDPILRVQRAIFVHMYGEKAWREDTFQGERDDCRLLALQFQDVLVPKWTLFDAVEKLTEQSVRLVFGAREVPPAIRKQVHDYAESYLEDLTKLFVGDALTHLKNPLAGKSVS